MSWNRAGAEMSGSKCLGSLGAGSVDGPSVPE